MVNLLNKFNESKRQDAIKVKEKMTPFRVGDTISVSYTITEGATTRIQNFEGTVIAKSKKMTNYDSSFVVRKISAGVGVERKFLFHSPLVVAIKLVKSGIVNRAKLYFLRNLSGKSARIKEDVLKSSTSSGESSAE